MVVATAAVVIVAVAEVVIVEEAVVVEAARVRRLENGVWELPHSEVY